MFLLNLYGEAIYDSFNVNSYYTLIQYPLSSFALEIVA
jgi:hypothetical protein